MRTPRDTLRAPAASLRHALAVRGKVLGFASRMRPFRGAITVPERDRKKLAHASAGTSIKAACLRLPVASRVRSLRSPLRALDPPSGSGFWSPMPRRAAPRAPRHVRLHRANDDRPETLDPPNLACDNPRRLSQGGCHAPFQGRTRADLDPEEDAAIREAAALNRRLGITGFELGDIQAGRRAMDDPYRNELRDVARAIGRTYAAVRKRAQRIGAASYATRAREGTV